jgi:glycerophosphoryl diester phosphodiesterase
MAKYFKIIDRLIFSGSINLNFVRENRSLFETADIFLNVEKILREQIKLNSINNNQVEIIIFSKEIINTCRELNVNIVNINEKLCTDLFLEKMKMNGIGVSVWTVDDPDRIMFFLKKEIENITTRNAVLAMKLKQGLINNGNKLC